jgi:hypothetical protein
MKIKNNNSLKEQNNKNYEFTGKITGKYNRKVYNKMSKHFRKTYFRLQVELENQKEIKEILVFQDSKRWKEIEKSQYVDRRYLFFCSPKVANYQIVSYQLVDWKELENHGSN